MKKVLNTILVGVQTNDKKRNLKSEKNYELVFTKFYLKIVSIGVHRRLIKNT